MKIVILRFYKSNASCGKKGEGAFARGRAGSAVLLINLILHIRPISSLGELLNFNFCIVWGQNQWRSQGLSGQGWAKMRKKMGNVWGKIRNINQNLRKVELLPTRDCEAGNDSGQKSQTKGLWIDHGPLPNLGPLWTEFWPHLRLLIKLLAIYEALVVKISRNLWSFWFGNRFLRTKICWNRVLWMAGNAWKGGLQGQAYPFISQ